MSGAELEGTVAIVTGAARGQGAAFARELQGRGAAVLLTDLREEDGAEVAASLGERAAFQRHDVADPVAWEEVVGAAEERFGKLTALVNNAGVNRPATLAETDEENWSLHLAVNQSGPFYGMRAAAPAIERAGGTASSPTARASGRCAAWAGPPRSSWRRAGSASTRSSRGWSRRRW